jgi:hypothetical protein
MSLCVVRLVCQSAIFKAFVQGLHFLFSNVLQEDLKIIA